MTSKRAKPLGSSLNAETKAEIHKNLDAMLENTAMDLGVSRAVVAREVFYRMQRHPDPDMRRNPTAAEKRAAFKYWGGACQRPGCDEPLEFKGAVFHHRVRGASDQHAPPNLRPYHAKCHDAEHAVRVASLSKGGPRRKG